MFGDQKFSFFQGKTKCMGTKVTLKTTTMAYGQEVSWKIISGQGEAVDCSGGNFNDHEEKTSDCCLSVGEHKVQCSDAYGDGWNGGSLTIGNQTFCGAFAAKNVEEEFSIDAHGDVRRLFFLFSFSLIRLV